MQTFEIFTEAACKEDSSVIKSSVWASEDPSDLSAIYCVDPFCPEQGPYQQSVAVFVDKQASLDLETPHSLNQRIVILDLKSELIHIFHQDLLRPKVSNQSATQITVDRICVQYPENYGKTRGSQNESQLRSPYLILLNSVDAVYYEVPRLSLSHQIESNKLFRAFRRAPIFEFKPYLTKGHYHRRRKIQDFITFLPKFPGFLLHIDKCKEC